MSKKTFQDLLDEDGRPVAKIAAAAEVNRSTLYRLAWGERSTVIGGPIAQRVAEALGLTMEKVVEAILETLKQKERKQ